MTVQSFKISPLLFNQIDSKYCLLEKHKELLSHMLSKHFKIKMPSIDFMLCDMNYDPYMDHLVINPELEQPVFFKELYENSMSFYTPIYRHSNGKGLVIDPDQIRFERYYKKVLSFLLTFYEDVEFIYVADCNFEHWLSDNVNILYTPNLIITKKYIRVKAYNPRHSALKQAQSHMQFDQFSFGMGHQTLYLDRLADKYNYYIVPKDCGFELDFETPHEQLKEQLLIVAMMLI